MAKVSGPLYSMSASGTIAKAMTYFGWKGVNVVRQWLKPANPMSSNQGDTRIILGGTGRSAGEVKKTSDFAQQLIDLGLVPGGQTKQSFLVKYIVDHYLAGSTAYAAMIAEFTAHTAKAAFQAAADSLGLVDFDLGYASIAPYDKGLGLYLIAKAAGALSFVGTPYTTNLTAWVTADVNGMVADFAAA